jgi:hypothetical protein
MSRFAAVLLSLAVVTAAHAKEKEGVQFPDTVQVGGKTLTLNGIGLRNKFFFKVYVAGLYLETPTKNAQEAISSDQTKRATLVMLRDLDKNQVGEAIRDGFNKNSGSQMATLKPKLDKLINTLSDVKKGEQLVITYSPGKGTVVSGSGGEKAAIEGKDFADALFSVWLGKQPVEEDLKKGMLGQ